MRWRVEIKSTFTPFWWYAESSCRTDWIKSTELVRRYCSQLRADTDDQKMSKAVIHTRLAHTASSTGEGSLVYCQVYAVTLQRPFCACISIWQLIHTHNASKTPSLYPQTSLGLLFHDVRMLWGPHALICLRKITDTFLLVKWRINKIKCSVLSVP